MAGGRGDGQHYDLRGRIIASLAAEAIQTKKLVLTIQLIPLIAAGLAGLARKRVSYAWAGEGTVSRLDGRNPSQPALQLRFELPPTAIADRVPIMSDE